MDFQKLFLSYDGRINRQPYWIATAIIIGAGVVSNFIPVLNLIFGFASIYFYVCIYNKRLHDLGRSGWWQLIPWVGGIGAVILAVVMMIPTIMQLASGPQDDEAVLAAMMGSGGVVALVLLAILLSLGFHIGLGVITGQRGPNGYGPDPLNPVETEVF